MMNWLLRRLGAPSIWILALLLALTGSAWLWRATSQSAPLAPSQPATRVDSLRSGSVATMDSAAFSFSPGWRADHNGADPSEPGDPFHEPAGDVTFQYSGRELALALAVGDFWGYLYVTVDGQPANLLPRIAGNLDSTAQIAGYKPLYAPELQTASGPTLRWVAVHTSDAATDHTARIEVWRSWGQTPIRAVAIDALPPPPWPAWPGVLLLLAAGWLGALGTTYATVHWRISPKAATTWLAPFHQLTARAETQRTATVAAVAAVAMIGVAVTSSWWWLCLSGLALLGLVSLVRPVLWPAAVLFALPFYFQFDLPLLPGRTFGLIDLSVLLGLPVVLTGVLVQKPTRSAALSSRPVLWLTALCSWALVAAVAAEHVAVALREWRTVFLMAALFGASLWVVLRWSPRRAADRSLLLAAWLAGATAVAAVAVGNYAIGASVIKAEGVARVAAFYGSPNNLAIYLDRTLALTLALALFAQQRRVQWIARGAAALQLLALTLTFSKGGLFLGLPAMLLTLWLGGLVILHQRGLSARTLWGLAVVVVAAGFVVLPFLGAERFQNLLSVEQGTGFLRLNLWRSAWQMALDHPWLGVGPDNFLYAYRSGYLLPQAWVEPNLNHPHNWLLDWWTRLGLPGLLIGIGYWTTIAVRLGAELRRKPGAATADNDDNTLRIGLLAAMATALAHGLIDISYALPDLMLVWALLGVVSSSLTHAEAANTQAIGGRAETT